MNLAVAQYGFALPQNLYAGPFNIANISTVLPKESHSATFTGEKVIQAISATPHMSEMDDSGLWTGSRFSFNELCLCNLNEQCETQRAVCVHTATQNTCLES